MYHKLKLVSSYNPDMFFTLFCLDNFSFLSLTYLLLIKRAKRESRESQGREGKSLKMNKLGIIMTNMLANALNIH